MVLRYFSQKLARDKSIFRRGRTHLQRRRIGVESLESRAMLATFGSGSWGWAGAVSPDNAIVKAVASDSTGNIYIAGHFSGSPDFDMGAGTAIRSSSLADGFVAKYSSAGSMQWLVHVAGPQEQYPTGIAVDPSGNVLVSGYFSGATTFGPGLGTTTSTSPNGYDGFVFKLNTLGQSQWVRTFGGGYGCYLGSIATDGTGAAIAVGAFRDSTIDFDPGAGIANLTASGRHSVVVKLDASGNYAWSGTFTSGEASDVATDGSGNILVTGWYQYTVDFDPGPGSATLTSNQGQAAYAVKLSTSGGYLWANSIGIGNIDWSRVPHGAFDGSGNAFVVGQFTGTVDFDPTAAVDSRSASGSSWDAFVTKYSGAGDYLWTTQISGSGDESVEAVATNAAGDVYLAGNFTGQVDADPGADVATFTSGGETDVLVAQLSAEGAYLTAKSYGGAAGDYASDIAIDSSGSAIIVGQFNDAIVATPVEFGPNQGDASLTGGDRPAFLLKLTNTTPMDIALSATSIAENLPSGATVGTLSTTNPDAGDAFTYTLVAGTGSTDNASFTIVGNQLRTAASFDYETKASYSIRIRSSDQGRLSVDKIFMVKVINLGEGPTALQQGLLAHFQLDGDARDSSPNKLHGTGSNVTAGRDRFGVENAALLFNGSNASVSVPHHQSLNSLPLSISMWFQTTATAGAGGLVGKYQAAGWNGYQVSMGSEGTAWPWYVMGRGRDVIGNYDVNGDNNSAFRSTPLNDGQWHHLVFTVDVSGGAMFVDGVLQATKEWRGEPTVVTNTLPLYIGRYFGEATGHFNGSIDDVRLYDRVLSPAEVGLLNTNRPPTDIAISATSNPENAGANAVVGTLTTTDPDADSTFAYTLVAGSGDTDNTAFNISGNQLRATASLDFETKSSYLVRLRSTDQGGLFTEKMFTITVTNVNEIPTDIVLSSSSIAENAGAHAVVGTLSTTDPDAGKTFTYTLVTGMGSTDNASFNISGNQLRATASLNFEAKSAYSIRIRSADAEGLYIEKAFVISVRDLSSTIYWLSNGKIYQGAADGSFQTIVVGTSQTAGGAITNLAVDPFGERIYWAELTEHPGNSRIYSAKRDGSDIRAVYSGSGLGWINYGMAVDETAGYVFLHSHDPAPVAALGPYFDGRIQRIEISTGSVSLFASGVWYARLAAYPQTQTLYFTDVSGFASGGPSIYRLNGLKTILYDGSGASGIVVPGEPPSGAIALDPASGRVFFATGEGNQTKGLWRSDWGGGSSVLVANTTSAVFGIGFDPNTDQVFWGDASGIHRVSSDGSLPSLLFTSSAVGSFAPHTTGFAVAIDDPNRTPTDISLSSLSIAENGGANAVVGTLTTTDPDAGSTFAYTLVAGSGDTDNTAFNISGNQLRATASLDFETKSSYLVRLRSTDQGGLSTEKAFVINVTDIPNALGATHTVVGKANPLLAGVAVRTYQPGEPGLHPDLLADLNTPATRPTALDVQGVTEIRVQAPGMWSHMGSEGTGAGGRSGQLASTHSPYESFGIAGLMNAPMNALVGVFTDNAAAVSRGQRPQRIDHAAGPITSPELNQLFFIGADAGRILVPAGATMLYFGLHDEHTWNDNIGELAVTVTLPGQAPNSLALSAASVAESNPAGTVVGTLSSVDPNPDDAFVYTLVSGSGSSDNPSFSIVGNQVRTAAVFDFETKNAYSIRVRSTDTAGLFIEKAFTITVSPSFQTIIEPEGQVSLAHGRTGVLRANGVPITTSAGVPYTIAGLVNAGWTPVAADVDAGQNTLVLRYSTGHITFLRFDANWQQVSSGGWITPGTNAFFAQELAFDADLGGDGLVTVETAGDVTLAYDARSGNLWAGGTPIVYQYGPVSYRSLAAAGWQAMAAEADAGGNTVVLRHSSGNLHFWRMDGEWGHVSGDGWIAPGSVDFFPTEVAFGVDLNGDGGVTVEASGNVIFSYDGEGNLRADGIVVTYNGGPMNYHSMVAVGWQAMAADVATGGQNTIVLKHASGYLHYWRLDANWIQKGGDGWTPIFSHDFFVAEVDFGADLDGDGGHTIEAAGSTILTYDRAGMLRAHAASGSLIDVAGTVIMYNDRPANYHALAQNGWTARAAELYQAKNTILLEHSSSYLHFWRFDATWTQISGDGWVKKSSQADLRIDSAFGIDLDGDGLIGA